MMAKIRDWNAIETAQDDPVTLSVKRCSTKLKSPKINETPFLLCRSLIFKTPYPREQIAAPRSRQYRIHIGQYKQNCLDD